ncbi:hypothetical protein AB6Q56_06725 [Dechloromonas sp. ARDL1]|uniref:hypothetical protein n=1 Tax=Dechloromonas sp. ARDL1 TaxID=3322121 RepID=UPI003DA6F65F
MNYRTANRQQQAARLLNQHYAETKENLLGDGLKLCRRAKAHNSHNPDTAYIEVNTKDGRTFANMRDVESPRELRRLHYLREWSHDEQIKQIFP